MMKVSKARIWIILITMLAFIVFGLYWFINNDVVLSETHPCFISDEKTALKDYLYDIYYAETGNAELAQYNIDESIANYGEDYMNMQIFPAIIYVTDISNTELLELMPIEINGLRGSVLHLPTEKMDVSTFISDARFTNEEMIKNGMSPGLDYYPIMACLSAKQEISPGLYNATVILDVLEPKSLIFK